MDDRSPKRSYRLAVSLPQSVAQYLERRSCEEGRSLSNLAAFILESAASQDQQHRNR